MLTATRSPVVSAVLIAERAKGNGLPTVMLACPTTALGVGLP